MPCGHLKVRITACIEVTMTSRQFRCSIVHPTASAGVICIHPLPAREPDDIAVGPVLPPRSAAECAPCGV